MAWNSLGKAKSHFGRWFADWMSFTERNFILAFMLTLLTEFSAETSSAKCFYVNSVKWWCFQEKRFPPHLLSVWRFPRDACPPRDLPLFQAWNNTRERINLIFLNKSNSFGALTSSFNFHVQMWPGLSSVLADPPVSCTLSICRQEEETTGHQARHSRTISLFIKGNPQATIAKC